MRFFCSFKFHQGFLLFHYQKFVEFPFKHWEDCIKALQKRIDEKEIPRKKKSTLEAFAKDKKEYKAFKEERSKRFKEKAKLRLEENKALSQEDCPDGLENGASKYEIQVIEDLDTDNEGTANAEVGTSKNST